MEIKLAYELLSDTERRWKYDQKGIIEENIHHRQERDSDRFHSYPFDDLFSHHGHHFNFQENDITFFHKLSITTR